MLSTLLPLPVSQIFFLSTDTVEGEKEGVTLSQAAYSLAAFMRISLTKLLQKINIGGVAPQAHPLPGHP